MRTASAVVLALLGLGACASPPPPPPPGPFAIDCQDRDLDVVFLIDTSDSTAEAVDGDAEGISVLAAEILAARTLMNAVGGGSVRFGVVAFAGDADELTPDAYTAVPLTSDRAEVERGLDALARLGSFGLSNFELGVEVATIELMGSESAQSARREGAERRIYVLADGLPTLPVPGDARMNARMAVQQAERAGSDGVVIDCFAIGSAAVARSRVLVDVARAARGSFTPLADPGAIESMLARDRICGGEKRKDRPVASHGDDA